MNAVNFGKNNLILENLEITSKSEAISEAMMKVGAQQFPLAGIFFLNLGLVTNEGHIFG